MYLSGLAILIMIGAFYSNDGSNDIKSFMSTEVEPGVRRHGSKSLYNLLRCVIHRVSIISTVFKIFPFINHKVNPIY